MAAQVLRDVQRMPSAQLESLQRNLLSVRPMFLWHTDPARKSAVDYVLHDICSWQDAGRPS